MKKSLIIFFLIFAATATNAQNNVVERPGNDYIIYGSTAENYIRTNSNSTRKFQLSTPLYYQYVTKDQSTGKQVTVYVEISMAECYDPAVIQQINAAFQAMYGCRGACAVTINIKQMGVGTYKDLSDGSRVFVPGFEIRITSANYEKS